MIIIIIIVVVVAAAADSQRMKNRERGVRVNREVLLPIATTTSITPNQLTSQEDISDKRCCGRSRTHEDP